MNSEYCNEKLDAGHYWGLKGYAWIYIVEPSFRNLLNCIILF